MDFELYFFRFLEQIRVKKELYLIFIIQNKFFKLLKKLDFWKKNYLIFFNFWKQIKFKKNHI